MKKIIFPELEKVAFEEVTTLRKDGGNYIPVALIDKKIRKSDEFIYDYCGDMYRKNTELSITGWQFNAIWSGRDLDWRDNITSDYTGLYHFINGELAYNDVNVDVYRRLMDKEYLIKTENGYKVNMVYCKNKEVVDKLEGILPEPSEKLVKLGEELDRDIFNIEKAGQPIHIYKILRFACQNRLASLKTYVLKNLADRGLLKEVTPEEAKGISTILFIER
jgi:hypothetical protein